MLNLIATRLLAQRAQSLTLPIRAAHVPANIGLSRYTPTISNLYLPHNYGSRSLRCFSTEISRNWPDDLRYILERGNITSPTLIQEKTLPLLMENKNLVGIARTGSGKTLAFAIPAILKILKSRENPTNQASPDDEDESNSRLNLRLQPKRHPKCLVLAPTRELADQTKDVFDKFRTLNIHSISLVGGKSRGQQVMDLMNKHYDIYVATPGRLLDLMQDQAVDLSHINYLVLDEADRMLDMGFEPQIRKIVTSIPNDRQTVMYSATWPQEIRELAQDFLNDYEYVAVDSEDLKANPNIKQVIKVCRGHERLDVLLELLKEFKAEVENPRVLVFVNRKRSAEQLLLYLMRNRIRATATHGDLSQKQRDDSLQMFKSKRCDLMIATDVASRGIDISDITHVVNYDFPNDMESYVHRIGRTARHDKKGSAVSLFTEDNARIASELIKVLRETNQEVPEMLERFAAMKFSKQVSEYGSKKKRDFYNSGGSYGSRNRGFTGQNLRFSNRQSWPGDYGRGSHRRDSQFYGGDERRGSYNESSQSPNYRTMFLD